MSKKTISNPFKVIFIFWALLLGAFIRLPYLNSFYAFPLGDGGLFAAIIKAIHANSYLLPETVSYNAIDIPLAYPPLGFYLVLLTSKISGMSTMWVFRFLPMAFNLLAIVSFVLLASELVRSKAELLACSTLFPIVFEGYEWFLKGGGITRSPGFFFMTLTLLFLVLYHKRAKPFHLGLVIASLSAAILTHAEWGVIAIVSIVAYLLTHDLHNWRGHVRTLVVIGLGAFALTSPWWLTVILRHGISPILAAGQSITPDQFLDYLSRIFSITVTPRQDFLLPWLAAIGVIVAIVRKNWFLPAWLVLIFLADARNTPKVGVLPLVFLIAAGLQGIDDFISRLLSRLRKGSGEGVPASYGLTSWIYVLAVLLILFSGWENKPEINSLQQSELSAMKFIADNSPQDAKFVVITQFNWYESDTAEWFPYLTERQSLTTPQGLEWVSSTEFKRTANLADELSTLARNEEIGTNRIQVREYVEKNLDQFDYVAVFVDDVKPDFGGFQDTGRYDIVFQKKNVLILEVQQNIK